MINSTVIACPVDAVGCSDVAVFDANAAAILLIVLVVVVTAVGLFVAIRRRP